MANRSNLINDRATVVNYSSNLAWKKYDETALLKSAHEATTLDDIIALSKRAMNIQSHNTRVDKNKNDFKTAYELIKSEVEKGDILTIEHLAMALERSGDVYGKDNGGCNTHRPAIARLVCETLAKEGVLETRPIRTNCGGIVIGYVAV